MMIKGATDSATTQTTALDAFRVGTGTHLLSGLFTRFPRFWRQVSRWESKILADQLESIEIHRPVYVTGLARSGTTLLLEILASHPDVATHQYRDFPALMIPYWWNQSHAAQGREVAVERAHGDRLMVTSSSPEAMEEMLWMSCFEHLHHPQRNQILDATTSHPRFEQLYRDHLRKLLLIRDGQRYVAKGNYNLTRIGYLQKLFPDARFLIPYRSPETHIASLIKQNRLFCAAEKAHPRALAHMQRVGHFEFGLDVRLINPDCTSVIDEIELLWKQGEEVRGWARYWSLIYGWLVNWITANPDSAQSIKLVSYEDLCQDPAQQLDEILQFAELHDPALIARWQAQISAPTYYESGFDDRVCKAIREETAHVLHDLETINAGK